VIHFYQDTVFSIAPGVIIVHVSTSVKTGYYSYKKLLLASQIGHGRIWYNRWCWKGECNTHTAENITYGPLGTVSEQYDEAWK